ncbi:MAG: virginiamycin lyase [Actinomycetota bacterium]|jgi:virginiamycin B lyase|nr:virginiamycin lyase [Actinomycetota bacterium]
MRHKPQLVDLRFDLYGTRPRHITTGDNEVLWVTCASVGEVAALFNDGTVEHFPTDDAPDQIARGTTTIWFTMPMIDSVGRIDPDGSIHTHKLPDGSTPSGLTTVGDDAWVTLKSTGELAKVSPNGQIEVLRPIVDGDSEPDNSLEVGGAEFIAADDGGSLWFARSGLGDIVRLDPDHTTDSWTSAECLEPLAIALDRDAAWITDAGSGGGIWRIGRNEKLLQRVEPWPTNVSSNIAADGNGGCWFTEGDEDLVAHIDTDAKLTEWDLSDYGERPRGIAVDKDEVAWVVLRTGGVVGLIAPTQAIDPDEPDYTVI